MSTASRRMRQRKVRAETTVKGVRCSTRPSPVAGLCLAWWVSKVTALGWTDTKRGIHEQGERNPQSGDEMMLKRNCKPLALFKDQRE